MGKRVVVGIMVLCTIISLMPYIGVNAEGILDEQNLPTIVVGEDLEIDTADGVVSGVDGVVSALDGEVQTGSGETYSGGFGITELLGKFQYFIKGNFKGDNSAHTVGAVAVGGTLDMPNVIGNYQKTANYIHYVQNVGGFFHDADASYAPAGGDGRTFYGDATSALKSNYLFTQSMYDVHQNDNYISAATFNSAFDGIKSESLSLVGGSEITGATLTFDFTGSVHSYQVTAAQLATATTLNLLVTNITDFQTTQNVISITGTDNVSLDFNGKIQVNGQPFANKLKSGLTTSVGGQLCRDGVKLIWNVPSASVVTATNLCGHLVAPNATVNVVGGNHEGSVIANAVESSSEAHFYPYVGGSSPETVSINLIKTGNGSPLAGAKFGLFSDALCTTKAVAGDPDHETTLNGTQAKVTFTITKPASETIYYIKETQAPSGYVASTTVYQCKVPTTGAVTYSTDGVTWSTDFPICNNVVVGSNSVSINLIKVDSATPAKNVVGAKFSLYTSEACTTEIAKGVTSLDNKTGSLTYGKTVVRFTNGESDGKGGTLNLTTNTKYYLKEIQAPSGYTINKNIYVCFVQNNEEVKYKLSTESDDKFSTSFPVCVDQVKKITEKEDSNDDDDSSSSLGTSGSTPSTSTTLPSVKTSTSENTITPEKFIKMTDTELRSMDPAEVMKLKAAGVDVSRWEAAVLGQRKSGKTGEFPYVPCTLLAVAIGIASIIYLERKKKVNENSESKN